MYVGLILVNNKYLYTSIRTRRCASAKCRHDYTHSGIGLGGIGLDGIGLGGIGFGGIGFGGIGFGGIGLHLRVPVRVCVHKVPLCTYNMRVFAWGCGSHGVVDRMGLWIAWGCGSHGVVDRMGLWIAWGCGSHGVVYRMGLWIAWGCGSHGVVKSCVAIRLQGCVNLLALSGQ